MARRTNAVPLALNPPLLASPLSWARRGVRLRAERQLGYKMPKYVQRIELVAEFNRIGGGKGGSWEDQGYQWYGGI